MKKLTREIVHKLRNQGMTFADIANMYEVTRQYVWSLYSGYAKYYRKTERGRMYKRHNKGHTNPSKPCDYCQQLPGQYPRQSKTYII